MSSELAPTDILGKASNEPVVIAGALRAVIYSVLGTRGLDPSILALIVVVAEAIVSVVLRRLVSPVGRQVTEAGNSVSLPGDGAHARTSTAAAGRTRLG